MSESFCSSWWLKKIYFGAFSKEENKIGNSVIVSEFVVDFAT